MLLAQHSRLITIIRFKIQLGLGFYSLTKVTNVLLSLLIFCARSWNLALRFITTLIQSIWVLQRAVFYRARFGFWSLLTNFDELVLVHQTLDLIILFVISNLNIICMSSISSLSKQSSVKNIDYYWHLNLKYRTGVLIIIELRPYSL